MIYNVSKLTYMNGNTELASEAHQLIRKGALNHLHTAKKIDASNQREWQTAAARNMKNDQGVLDQMLVRLYQMRTEAATAVALLQLASQVKPETVNNLDEGAKQLLNKGLTAVQALCSAPLNETEASIRETIRNSGPPVAIRPKTFPLDKSPLFPPNYENLAREFKASPLMLHLIEQATIRVQECLQQFKQFEEILHGKPGRKTRWEAV